MKKNSMELSLEELENDFWGEPRYTSHLVRTCHELRKVPLKNLTVENLRMLIGQKIGLEYFVIIALGILEENPLCSGDYYNGDLLSVVLKIEKNYWRENNELLVRLSDIMDKLKHEYEIYQKDILPKWNELFM